MTAKDGATPPRPNQLTEHLPKDRKGNPISIGDRVWYYGAGSTLNPSIHGYQPMVLVCEMPVTAVGTDFIFAGDSLVPIPSEHVYTDLTDAFRVLHAALKGRFDPKNRRKSLDTKA